MCRLNQPHTSDSRQTKVHVALYVRTSSGTPFWLCVRRQILVSEHWVCSDSMTAATTQPFPYKNRILASLPKNEVNRLARHLEAMPLKQGHSLLDGKATHAYFLEEGMASVVLSLASGDTIEVGVIGKEGLVGLPILLGTRSVPGRTFMQIGGSGFRIKAESLIEEFERGGELRNILQKHMQGLLVQSAQTAACNRLHAIEERLARWLLTCHDRVEEDLLLLTHDFLAQMLGSPRTTVTLAAGALQRANLIDYSRGKVTILDRAGLEKSSCECYRSVRDEFRRLGLFDSR
jgi:CRP-like cAMP-binding protein